MDVPAWYWDMSASAGQGRGGDTASFARAWQPPRHFGAAVSACSSGGVTCVGFASGRVVALAGDWGAPVWVWDEGGRVTCVSMFGGCVVWGLADGAVCVGCLRTGDCVRWVCGM
jgi:hypothetical protein